MRRFLLIAGLFWAGLTMTPRDAMAQGIPNAVPCPSARAMNGMVVGARQVVGPSNFWAVTSWPNGMPLITYSQAYFSLPAVMQLFTSLHECGHATLVSANEFQANCFALRSGMFNAAQIAFIRAYHQGIGPLPMQYGGSGFNFWMGTIQSCSEFGVF